ncbi:MAG TPA: hypothetical protein VHU82_10230 [Vicinamibacterales bacterium]|nr:hypothetical protein [Vicinamibacterales bacterium]
MLCLLMLLPATARAVTIDQIVSMSKAGVSDAVIVAMIDHDRSVFTLDPAQLVELQQAGVSDAVTVAMIRTDARDEQTSIPPPEPTPAVAPEQSAVVAYAVPYVVVPGRARSRRVAATTSVVAPAVTVVAPAVQAATSARGMFFTQPATGMFFQPPAAAVNCPTPPPSPHRR